MALLAWFFQECRQGNGETTAQCGMWDTVMVLRLVGFKDCLCFVKTKMLYLENGEIDFLL